MANKLKKGDIIVATDDISDVHKRYPDYYPAPGTAGMIIDTYDCNIYVQWSKGSTSLNDDWYSTNSHVRKVTKRDISYFVKYYDQYAQTATASVKQYYKRPSKTQSIIEERLIDQMKSLKGYGYKVLGGSSQHFIAAFMVGNILYVYASKHYQIDTVFTKKMSDARQEERETLEALMNDAFADIISDD